MHLIRLLMMAIDILEKGEIKTHRTAEHELLQRIRRGDFQQEDKQFSKEFYDMLEDYENRLKLATAHSILPDEPDMKKVEQFVEYVNRRAVDGEY
jgi:hypothetical protein